MDPNVLGEVDEEDEEDEDTKLETHRLIEHQGDSIRIRYLKMTLRRRQIPIASLARIRGCRECFRAGLSRRKADLYFRINPSDLEK